MLQDGVQRAKNVVDCPGEQRFFGLNSFSASQSIGAPSMKVVTMTKSPAEEIMHTRNFSVWIKRGVLLLGLAIAIVLGISTVFRSGPHKFGDTSWGSPYHRTDFTVYTAAGRAVIDGSDLYKARNDRGWNYIYPPLFAIVMVPLAKLSTFGHRCFGICCRCRW